MPELSKKLNAGDKLSDEDMAALRKELEVFGKN